MSQKCSLGSHMTNTPQPNEDRTPEIGMLLGDRCGLSSYGEWLLTQLEIARYWAASQRGSEDADNEARNQEGSCLPTRWEMTRGIQLWGWQRQCAQTWLDQGHRGIAKVVTGAGKTIFAQHLIERLQTEQDPELRVAIVVPTIVLMHQWVDSLTNCSNLPPHSVGCLGGGSGDVFKDSTRILVCVLNSASTRLAERVRKAAVGDHLLLVIDECHRATGRSMSKVFGTARRYNLGLSATPEREDGPDAASADDGNLATEPLRTEITTELGPVVYELGVAEAVRLGILSTFEIMHYGLQLETDERAAYLKLSRDIQELARTLKAASGRGRSSPSPFRSAQHYASRPGSAFHAEGSQYLMKVRARKRLLDQARARTDAVLGIVARTLAESPESKILLFHESISEVMRLYVTLLRGGYKTTVDHSKLPDSLRAASISLFRSAAANVLVSARTLIEGFDVPAADVGIIAASSTSARQRVQTIGRVLRRPKDGTRKRAVIHTLYMAGTVDEAIYGRADWAKVTGAKQNLYFLWSPPPPHASPEELASEAYAPVAQPGPPRQPRPTEKEVDWCALSVGGVYPGKFEGEEYQCDHQGNVLDMAGRPVGNPQEVPCLVADACGGATRFKVTPVEQAILCWDRRSQSVKWVGNLEEPFRATSHRGTQAPTFRVTQVKGERRIKNRAGKFALDSRQADDPQKGQDAEQVVKAIEELEKQLGRAVLEFMIDGDEAYCVVNGQRHSLCRLRKGLEFK